MNILHRKPRRISITLSFYVYEELLKRSDLEGRSVSNLCAFLLEEALLKTSGSPQPLPTYSLSGNHFLGAGHNGASCEKQRQLRD